MEPNDNESRDEPTPKLAYEAPCIVETAEFETLALACGLTGGLACVRAGGLTSS